MMNCQEVESKILEYCDAPASSELHNQVSLHLQRCEPCRNNYKLTRAESEILSESPDIPELSSEFTSSVIGAIRKNLILYPHSPIKMIKEQPLPAKKRPSFRIWGTLAAAAILGIGIYSAGSYVPFKNASLVDTQVANQEMSQTVATLPDASDSIKPTPVLNGSGPIEIPAKSADESKSNVVDKLSATPKLLSSPSGQEASRQTLMATSGSGQALKETNYTLNDLYIANVPEQFYLAKIGKLSNNHAEYSYTSSDGLQNFTISVNLLTPTVGLEPVNAKITKDVTIGSQQAVLAISGDLPDQFLVTMADSIQLKAIKP